MISPTRTRTWNLAVNSRSLYQLSYRGNGSSRRSHLLQGYVYSKRRFVATPPYLLEAAILRRHTHSTPTLPTHSSPPRHARTTPSCPAMAAIIPGAAIEILRPPDGTILWPWLPDGTLLVPWRPDGGLPSQRSCSCPLVHDPSTATAARTVPATHLNHRLSRHLIRLLPTNNRTDRRQTLYCTPTRESVNALGAAAPIR